MLYLFDIDDTLIRSFIRETKQRQDYEKVEVLPGRKERLEELRQLGHDVALVTNQGGIAFGYQTKTEVNSKMFLVLEELGFPKHEGLFVACQGRRENGSSDHPVIYMSLKHPKAKIEEFLCDPVDDWRKPGGGMLRQAMADYGVTADKVTFVGDLDTDRLAAAAAGVRYMDVEEFFGAAEPVPFPCDWCPNDVRNLYAVAHNAHNAYRTWSSSGADRSRMDRKMAELEQTLAQVGPLVDKHFDEKHHER